MHDHALGKNSLKSGDEEHLMNGFAVRAIFAAALVSGAAMLGAHSAATYSKREDFRSDLRRHAHAKLRGPAAPLSYRSPGSRHKLWIDSRVAHSNDSLMASLDGSPRRHYATFDLVDATAEQLSSLTPAELERIAVRDDFNIVLLKRGQIDTTGPEPLIPSDLRQPSSLIHSLHLVQLAGPPDRRSMQAIKATGAKVVSYVPNNTYLVWASSSEIARLKALRARGEIVQWESPFHPAYKIHPMIDMASTSEIAASIQIVNAEESLAAIHSIEGIANRFLMKPLVSGKTIHLKVKIDPVRVTELAGIPEVMMIEPWAEIRLRDERADEIITGSISQDAVNNASISTSSTPTYSSFLAQLGLPAAFDFAVDIGDTGLDMGSADPAKLHPDFHDPSGASRVAYVHDETGDPHEAPAHDPSGHGTLNASVMGGFSDKSGSPFADPQGFRYGLGIAPQVRVGASKLFADNGDFQASFFDFVRDAYREGARITSNSWGACDLGLGFCNLYADDCAIFDSLARDADLETPGNQEMIIVFAAGNEGDLSSKSIDVPGSAKNVIAVGASENLRPTDVNGAPVTDGCGVRSSEADDAVDMALFSSGGPVQDGRAKPDLVAPGTHIQGAASQDSAYTTTRDLGVCNRYFPTGQTLYTWSSGTSHSTPIVAGGAAPAFQWLRGQIHSDPSPALVKGLLLNSATYLTGVLGGGSLPGSRQGWGLMNLGRAFETADRIIYDQSPDRIFSESGGPAFEIAGVITDPSKELRAMLTWTDPPGDGSTNAPYVNQLDLELVINGALYRGNHFNGQYSAPGGQPDILNNVQGIRLPAGTTGSFVLRVRPMIIAGDGVPGNNADLDQDFSLVMTNARETPAPVLEVAESDGVASGVTVTHSNGSTDHSVIPGETARITIAVNNVSKNAAAAITAASLKFSTGAAASAAMPVIDHGASAANSTPFQLAVPSGLRCGSAAMLELQLTTSFGITKLPVAIRVGRASGSGAILFSDDVDSGIAGWKMKSFSIASNLAHSGVSSYRAVDRGNGQDDSLLATLLRKQKIAIPAEAGRVRLSFFQVFNFEPGFDGGVLEISSDGGDSWQDLGSRIITGGYDGKVTGVSSNPLGDRFAWTARGRPGIFSQVVIDLDDFAGMRIKIRFLAGFDEATGVKDGYAGWYIDDIRITADLFSCGSVDEAAHSLPVRATRSKEGNVRFR